MDTALSLKSGEHVEARTSNYATSRELLLVCPECGDPVHFKLREIPYTTPFFAHPKEQESIKLIKACSLRIQGGVFQRASDVVPGISHGQLVNRFQREFCKELYESLGTHSKTLYEFVKNCGFAKRDKKNYRLLIHSIETSAPGDEILHKAMDESERVIFKEGIDDICRFLISPYGVWVGNFIYQTAYFIASILHPGTLNKSLGNGVFRVKKTWALFVAESSLVKKFDTSATKILPGNSKRNAAIPQIAAALVSFLILKWRFQSHIPKLLVLAGADFDKVPPAPKPPVSKVPAKNRGDNQGHQRKAVSEPSAGMPAMLEIAAYLNRNGATSSRKFLTVKGTNGELWMWSNLSLPCPGGGHLCAVVVKVVDELEMYLSVTDQIYQQSGSPLEPFSLRWDVRPTNGNAIQAWSDAVAERRSRFIRNIELSGIESMLKAPYSERWVKCLKCGKINHNFFSFPKKCFYCGDTGPYLGEIGVETQHLLPRTSTTSLVTPNASKQTSSPTISNRWLPPRTASTLRSTSPSPFNWVTHDGQKTSLDQVQVKSRRQALESTGQQFPAKLPISIGIYPVVETREDVPIVKKILSRLAILGGSQEFKSSGKWLYFTDIFVLVNPGNLEFVNGKSFVQKDGFFVLETERGEIKILSSQVSWK